ncbi:hypothetical protein [Herbaspirillum sp. NPDC087042]|uniref:hypothetical protein n=1 Tax=Herbaspirillum sp. NPDC087042 TaxID=3364004 RepID=UPI00380D0FCA
MTPYAERIAGSYILIVTNIGEMAESGEFVSDLPCSAVTACISAMQKAGATPSEIFDLFATEILERYGQASPERAKYRAVLERAYTEAASLLLPDDSPAF